MERICRDDVTWIVVDVDVIVVLSLVRLETGVVTSGVHGAQGQLATIALAIGVKVTGTMSNIGVCDTREVR